MQYQQGSEKVVPVNADYIPVSQQARVNDDLEMRRTRKILLIILGVLLGLSVLSGISSVARSDDGYSSLGTSSTARIREAFVSIIYYSFGALVAYRYSVIGLRVFAWITIIILTLGGIGIIGLFVFAGFALSASSHVDSRDNQFLFPGLFVLTAFIGIFIIASFILLIIVVKLSFKLARLIEDKRNVILLPV